MIFLCGSVILNPTKGGVKMSYDGIVLRAVSLELNSLLQGARIDKIYQPGKSEIILNLRQPGQTYRLLLSALAQDAGVFLSGQSRSNPSQPPLFCMVLRKHLEGGKILSVKQPGLERVLEITCDVADELGERVNRCLTVEIMGKHSNIILLDPQNMRIIDSIFRVPPSLSRYRQVLPGQPYLPPPPQEKILPWEITVEAFFEKLVKAPLTQSLSKSLLANFSGLGPQTAEEIVGRAGLDPKYRLEFCGEYELSRLWQVFHDFAVQTEAGRFTPEVIIHDEIPQTFSAVALTGYPPRRTPCLSKHE